MFLNGGSGDFVLTHPLVIKSMPKDCTSNIPVFVLGQTIVSSDLYTMVTMFFCETLNIQATLKCVYSTWFAKMKSHLGIMKEQLSMDKIGSELELFRSSLQFGRTTVQTIINHWYNVTLQPAWQEQQRFLCRNYGACLSGDHTFKIAKKLSAYDPKTEKMVLLINSYDCFC